MKKIINWLVEHREWSWLAMALLGFWGMVKYAKLLSDGRPLLDPMDVLVNVSVPLFVYIVFCFLTVKILPHHFTFLSDEEYKSKETGNGMRLLDLCATCLSFLLSALVFLGILFILRR